MRLSDLPLVGGAYRTALAARYRAGRRVAWSRGYLEYRRGRIARVLADAELLRRFATRQPLPPRFGHRLDERIVEYPWVISRLPADSSCVLDAGGAVEDRAVRGHAGLAGRRVVSCALSGRARPGVAHVTADLRSLPLRDASVDAVLCISTIEHIGMDNTRVYGLDVRYREHSPLDYRRALAEFSRALAQGGVALVTVPFGRAANLGWLQVFDEAGVVDIAAAFDGAPARVDYFRYHDGGWQLAGAEDCRDSDYYDVHSSPSPPADSAAAARAVACLELRRE